MMSKPVFWQPSADPQAVTDPRLRAPSAQRNRDAILAVLADILPSTGLVLEIASGSGEHAVHFAAALPGLIVQPSDPSPHAVASIAAWITESGRGNILPPLVIDATAPDWPLEAVDAILCINMIHIAPWTAAEGLFRHAGRLLKPGQPLYLYGPYRRPGRPLEPGNAAFDESLRGRDPAWGLREQDAVAALGAANGFGAPEVIEMPVNNLSLIFRKT
jgi:SAM-dependent methyltransferase